MSDRMRSVRVQSESVLRHLGYVINPSLPLLDEGIRLRSKDEIVDRVLVVDVTVAVANGANRQVGLAWLEQEGLTKELTSMEQQWLHESDTALRSMYLAAEEADWALMWILGFVSELSFDEYCQPTLAAMFPRIGQQESSIAFRHRATLRPIEEVIQACDVAYCFHAFIKHAHLTRQSIPLRTEPYVIEQRRKALEWALSADDWDNVALDT